MTFFRKNAVKSARSWGVLGLVLALAVVTFLVGYGQRPAGPLAAVTLANQQLRAQVASAMASTAAAAGVKIETGNMVFASRDDIILVNAGVAEIEKIGMEQLAKGVTIGFVLLARPDGRPITMEIPPGFYSVKVIVTPGGQPGVPPTARAQLIQNGKVILERSAKVGPPSAPMSRWTGSLGEGGFCVDYHWSWGSIELCIFFT